MLLPLPNVQQQQAADCLVACAKMILDYLQIPVGYSQLTRHLGTDDFGTPFPSINRLQSLGLFVEWGMHQDDFTLLEQHLKIQLPIIAGVQTWALPSWRPIDTQHAVVVVGLSDGNVYLNDPAFEAAPQIVAAEEFLNAWSDRDFIYAVIALIEPE